ncbi:DUF488 domain-containing protein [Chitinophaga filiformis]|uniref:Uncharacterized conserved protein YeaO, DUF488 family n=1 Tax=Chitinophaga filiformis TaxID=104663 RepID=A0A1G7T032_CHIFI|nr:DUF488 domain-containing protein [Chitinophaga filiformis]SDG28384.1 Uncharacterized conserved protein YeaO, DUF488 family [Chitinophaga filiformis]
MQVVIKRAYDPADPRDGYRILVDRLWPRGIKKEAAEIDQWLKEVAPSTKLRTWFGHDPAKWREFKKRYREELKDNEAWEELQDLARGKKKITLVYAAKDEEHNQAVVLEELLGEE